MSVIDAGPDGMTPGVELYWIPLGAGAHVVRISGRFYEALPRSCTGDRVATCTTPRSSFGRTRPRS